MPHALVAYASKHGSTEEIAEAVAQALRDHGVEADCLDAGAVRSLDDYDAVVLGSAVYMKRWRSEARHFLRHFAGELDALPFWVFSSGPVGDPAQDAAGWTEPPKQILQAERLGVRDHVVFGGRVPDDPHGPMQRAMVKDTPEEFRDRRDWNEIGAWGASIAAALRAPA